MPSKITRLTVCGSNDEFMPTFPMGKELELAPGANVILGTNDRGKSVLLRGILDALRMSALVEKEQESPLLRALNGRMIPPPPSYYFVQEQTRIEEAVRKGLALNLKCETWGGQPSVNFITCENARDKFKGIREVDGGSMSAMSSRINPGSAGVFGNKVFRVAGTDFEGVLDTITPDVDLLLLDEPTSRWGFGKTLRLLEKALENIGTDGRQLIITEHSPISLAWIVCRLQQEREFTRHKVFYFLRDRIEEGAVKDISLKKVIEEDVGVDEIEGVTVQIRSLLECAKSLF